MEESQASREKFDLRVEFERRNTEYENFCAEQRLSKPSNISFYDPFTMNTQELWERKNSFNLSGITKAEIPFLMEQYRFLLAWSLKREPTADELIQHLKEHFKQFHYVFFDPNIPVTTLTKGFKKIIKEAKTIKNKFDDSKKKDVLSGYRTNELKRYLAVYDARETQVNGKKTKWVSVCKKLFPKKNFDEEVRQSLLRDHRKACEIIKKVFM